MTDFFKFKAPDFDKLKLYGFQENGDWEYRKDILEGQFLLTVCISKNGQVKTELTDTLTGEPYTLHLVEDAAGAFVGSVREAYSAVLEDIAARCFDTQIFKSGQTHALIAHVREKYGDEPEYLWEKFPDNAVFRRGNTGKWYGIIMTVQRKKLGLEGEGDVEVLDMRMDPTELALLVDGKRYFPGWHMNKKHWFTVPLDGTLPTDELYELLEGSWQLAK